MKNEKAILDMSMAFFYGLFLWPYFDVILSELMLKFESNASIKLDKNVNKRQQNSDFSKTVKNTV